ncbi:MAG: hypothetical protein ACFWT0_08515 [Bifidobacterium crudilactis]|jgi:hypothetical protein
MLLVKLSFLMMTVWLRVMVMTMIDFLKSICDQFVVLFGRLWAWFLLTDVGMWLADWWPLLGVVLMLLGSGIGWLLIKRDWEKEKG